MTAIDIPSNLSTAALQHKYQQLKDQAEQHGQILTQKLASSQSGQNLLHMGSSLSTLPTDLHFLLTQLHPLLQGVEQSEGSLSSKLNNICERALVIKKHQRRVIHAQECADSFEDLLAAEKIVQLDLQMRKYGSVLAAEARASGDDEERSANDDDTSALDDALDHALSLERAAHIAQSLIIEVQQSQDDITDIADDKASNNINASLPPDTERAQFFLQLAPRIRHLEADVSQSLAGELERLLLRWTQQNLGASEKEILLLRFGHAVRGLSLIGRATDAESVFARTSIMPLIREHLSMGRLDQGGARGECAGLTSLLDDLSNTLAQRFGDFLQMDYLLTAGIDLLTRGVWVPLATTLMTDSAVRMAIFSPGIAKILQTNYLALDSFLNSLAVNLLREAKPEIVKLAQQRIYEHPKTAEFSKKWNLPIYYQLRFGECSKRLNIAIETTTKEGWVAQVYSGESETTNFELSLFQELNDILLFLWRRDVLLPPLTNRFLRGALQLVGRMTHFIQEGMDGKIRFGQEPVREGEANEAPDAIEEIGSHTYCWADSEENVAAVTWELSVLEGFLRDEYSSIICKSLDASPELSELVKDILSEAADQILPLLDTAWNAVIVRILTEKCCTPLALVKGVAATYRMTNRPPPTQPSHFCDQILRPVKEFSEANRTPSTVGFRWKQQIVVQVADRYATAVEELLTTVARTEVALQRNRRASRLTTAGGMSDGEKVKLQLYLDCQAFLNQVHSVGINPETIIGLVKLQDLTKEGEALANPPEQG
ncbi:hypothetical protein FisN_21Lh173 [Fistulifera solaris]|uniref:COG complex component COG2 C-terminal domain-containing protein n=1 Tax=Fistulifera solaris TaxID=1519565 RepID=A0A1Z5J900_FISSO|nr:hypothetical protein FisN_21Lh173 [Fistulifera solaris]|eukprot:GAX10474.1 hypothetical protein FisN_21Lh173 [Fistulifera solaris]